MLRTIREVFSNEPYPTVSFAFRTNEFDGSLFQKVHFIEQVKDKTNACCYEYEGSTSPLFCYVILVHRNYFLNSGGWDTRQVIKKALYHKYKARLMDQWKGTRPELMGMLWTNDLQRYSGLFDQKVSDIKIWDQKSLAKKDYRRTANLLSWITQISTHLQKNVHWKEMGPTFSEYVDNVNYPFDTLLLNFQSAALKLRGKDTSLYMR